MESAKAAIGRIQAGAAVAATLVHARVDTIVGMAARAVCLPRIMRGRPDAAHNVFAGRHGLQVSRANAWAGAAEMIKGVSSNRPMLHFIGDSMCDVELAVHAEVPIAPAVQGASPYPAACAENARAALIHLAPEPTGDVFVPAQLDRPFGVNGARLPEAHVVSRAIAACLMFSVAVSDRACPHSPIVANMVRL